MQEKAWVGVSLQSLPFDVILLFKSTVFAVVGRDRKWAIHT